MKCSIDCGRRFPLQLGVMLVIVSYNYVLLLYHMKSDNAMHFFRWQNLKDNQILAPCAITMVVKESPKELPLSAKRSSVHPPVHRHTGVCLSEDGSRWQSVS